MSLWDGDQPDRRAWSRYQVSFDCNYQTTNMSGSGVVTNVSNKGAFVQTPEPPTLGELADLTLRCAPKVEIKVAARVVHLGVSREADRQGFGLRFLRFSGPHSGDLEKLLKKRRQHSIIWS